MEADTVTDTGFQQLRDSIPSMETVHSTETPKRSDSSKQKSDCGTDIRHCDFEFSTDILLGQSAQSVIGSGKLQELQKLCGNTRDVLLTACRNNCAFRLSANSHELLDNSRQIIDENLFQASRTILAGDKVWCFMGRKDAGRRFLQKRTGAVIHCGSITKEIQILGAHWQVEAAYDEIQRRLSQTTFIDLDDRCAWLIGEKGWFVSRIVEEHGVDLNPLRTGTLSNGRLLLTAPMHKTKAVLTEIRERLHRAPKSTLPLDRHRMDLVRMVEKIRAATSTSEIAEIVKKNSRLFRDSKRRSRQSRDSHLQQLDKRVAKMEAATSTGDTPFIDATVDEVSAEHGSHESVEAMRAAILDDYESMLRDLTAILSVVFRHLKMARDAEVTARKRMRANQVAVTKSEWTDDKTDEMTHNKSQKVVEREKLKREQEFCRHMIHTLVKPVLSFSEDLTMSQRQQQRAQSSDGDVFVLEMDEARDSDSTMQLLKDVRGLDLMTVSDIIYTMGLYQLKRVSHTAAVSPDALRRVTSMGSAKLRSPCRFWERLVSAFMDKCEKPLRYRGEYVNVQSDFGKAKANPMTRIPLEAEVSEESAEKGFVASSESSGASDSRSLVGYRFRDLHEWSTVQRMVTAKLQVLHALLVTQPHYNFMDAHCVPLLEDTLDVIKAELYALKHANDYDEENVSAKSEKTKKKWFLSSGLFLNSSHKVLRILEAITSTKESLALYHSTGDAEDGGGNVVRQLVNGLLVLLSKREFSSELPDLNIRQMNAILGCLCKLVNAPSFHECGFYDEMRSEESGCLILQTITCDMITAIVENLCHEVFVHFSRYDLPSDCDTSLNWSLARMAAANSLTATASAMSRKRQLANGSVLEMEAKHIDDLLSTTERLVNALGHYHSDSVEVMFNPKVVAFMQSLHRQSLNLSFVARTVRAFGKCHYGLSLTNQLLADGNSNDGFERVDQNKVDLYRVLMCPLVENRSMYALPELIDTVWAMLFIDTALYTKCCVGRKPQIEDESLDRRSAHSRMRATQSSPSCVVLSDEEIIRLLRTLNGRIRMFEFGQLATMNQRTVQRLLQMKEFIKLRLAHLLNSSVSTAPQRSGALRRKRKSGAAMVDSRHERLRLMDATFEKMLKDGWQRELQSQRICEEQSLNEAGASLLMEAVTSDDSADSGQFYRSQLLNTAKKCLEDVAIHERVPYAGRQQLEGGGFLVAAHRGDLEKQYYKHKFAQLEVLSLNGLKVDVCVDDRAKLGIQCLGPAEVFANDSEQVIGDQFANDWLLTHFFGWKLLTVRWDQLQSDPDSVKQRIRSFLEANSYFSN